MTSATRCVAALLLASTICVNAAQSKQTDPSPEADASPPAQTMDLSEVIALLQQQQKDLSEQKELLQAQSLEIAGLKQELDILRAPTPTAAKTIAVTPAEEPPDTTITPTQRLTPEQLAVASDTSQPKTQEQKKIETGKSVAKAQADDPTRAMLEDFIGGWRLPGTDAALRIGGYVKASVVNSFDGLEIKDRFIVGSIPVGDDGDDGDDVEAQSSITASQSRLNFDLREPTDVGILRAFIEGDFAGDGETFRLRHAFGQRGQVLAGKTWSAFVDTQASPEEVDFEGLNGRINVRQSQVRIMPNLGKKYEFQFSMEDPNPQVQNAQGVSKAPDIIASARFQPHPRLHVKLGLLGRQIRAQLNSSEGTGIEKQYAWGSTISGRFATPMLDERDSLLFQFNAGDGIGRYVNDLSSVGSFDGIIDPETGELKLFDILAGYVSFQHWWPGGRNMRSNFTFGVVEVDNPDFVSGDAYKRTLRFSSNLMWTPTPRIDLGAEYLWGNRKNEDGNNGDATQVQVAARYRF
ncbi:MAG: hypothetical protein DRR04_10665 [Gammaproteobacteria bacterium]|nr:MAG: hypothetical protein DRR04_10665 [Gammaproteobacteria bacterium]